MHFNRMTAKATGSTSLRYLAFLLYLLGGSGYALAQNTGSIFGNVSDSSSAAIPNAQVKATSHGQGLVRTTVTNASGSYILSALPIGTYTVTVEAAGFEEFSDVDVRVDADQNARVDATLKPGQVTQQVTVSGASPQVDTHSDTISTIIPQELVEDMPNSGRNPISFVTLLPGVSNVSAAAAFAPDRNGPTFNVSGSRNSSNLLLLDGLMHSNLFRNTGQNYPPPDFLSEIETLLDNYGAQYGHNTGAIFNAITKSGTNEVHGSLWEYDQNTAFNASNYYTRQPAAAHINQFGATVGGPIIHNHLYYFFGYEGYRQSKSSFTSSALPPTAAERGLNGPADFSADAAAAKKNPNAYLLNPAYPKGTSYALLLPVLPAGCAGALGSGQYIANAQIPNVCLNPVIQNLNSKYVPLPAANGTYTSIYATPLNNDVAEGRADWNFGKHTIDGRYIILNTSTVGYTTSTTALPNYEALTQLARTQTISVNDTFVATPKLLNVLRLGYNRFYGTQTPTDRTSLHDLGSAFPVLALPVLPAINITSRLILSSNSTDQQINVNEDLDFLDSATLTRGNHTLQAGGEYLRLQYLNRSYFYTMGQFNFTGQITNNPVADYVLGIVQSATAESPRLEQSAIQNNMYLFLQDDWKATERLTLNLGLRYELPFPWYQPQNYWATFRPGQQSTKIPTAPAGLVYPGDAGIPRGLVPTRFSGFAPRFGFALDLFGTGRTALRGGFGIFYDETSANIVQNQTQPFVYQLSPLVTPASISDPYKSGPAFPVTVNLTNPTFTTPFTLNYPDPALRIPYVEAFNLGVQQQVLTNVALEIEYVGKLGRHQMLAYNPNPALYAKGAAPTQQSYQQRRTYPTFGNNTDMATIGTSNYNALQIQVSKRLSSWLSARGAYTYSRSLDEFSSDVTDTATPPNVFSTPAVPAAGSPLNFNLSSEYGLSTYNATHIGSLGYTAYGPKFLRRNLLLRELAGGWNLSGIYSIRSGQPLNITFGSNDYADTNTPNQRPNVLHAWALPSGRSRLNKLALSGSTYFDPTAFSTSVPSGTFGSLRRDVVTGPASIGNNMSLAKNFAIPGREGMILQLRCDAFGVFNTPNLGTPGTTVGSSLGRITSTSGERYLQLSGHLHF